jgi:hypothetical protein
MFAKNDVKPWWERVNDYYLFEERENFTRGALGYQPNNKQEEMFAQLMAGNINRKHSIPKSLGKQSNEKSL